MSKDIVMGIDVGTYATKAVILGKSKNEHAPQVLGVGLSESHGLRKGYIVNPDDAAESIKAAVKKAQEHKKISLKNTFIAINGMGLLGMRSKGSILVSRADNKITPGDVERAIEQSKNQMSRSSSSAFLNREIVNSFMLSCKIDGEEVMGDPVEMNGEKLEVDTFFISCVSQHIASLDKSLNLAGLTLEDAVTAPDAAGNAILNQKEKEVGVLLLNIGSDTSTAMVYEEGKPISLGVFHIGSSHITYDIAQGLQVPLDEAEELKLTYGPEPSLKRKMQNIIEARLSDVFELVQDHLKKINRLKLLPAGIILTGGGANITNIEETAKKALSLPAQVRYHNNFGDCKHPINNPVWSTAIGLCYGGLYGKNGISSASAQKHRGKILGGLIKGVKYLIP
jgi:cell division protein FtsA